MEYSKIFKSKYAAILNLYPDHIERHKNINQYIKAKFKLLKNQNKDVKWKSYKHNIHGFIFPGLDTKGDLNINNVQIDAINDIIEFFNSNL